MPGVTPVVGRWLVQCAVFVMASVLMVHVVRSFRNRLQELHGMGSDLALRTAEVRAREADLNRAQTIAHVGSWTYDIADDVMHLSAETCRIFGVPEGTRGNRDAFLARVHPDDRPAMEAIWRVALEGGGGFDHEHRIVSGETVRWVRQTAEMELGRDRRPLRCVGTTQDITERERHQAETLQARNRLAATLDAIPDLLFEVGLDGRFHDYHSPHADLLFMPIEQLLGRTARDVLPPTAAEVYMAALREAHETGRSHGRQVELPLPKGTAWFELSVARKPVGRGWDPRFIIIARDITQRKLTEAALRASELQMKRILGATADGILAFDAEGRVIQTNARFVELWRIPRPLRGDKDDKALLVDMGKQLVDPVAVIARVNELFRSDEEATDVLHFKDGRIFERVTAPLMLNGANVGRVWSFRDVTERVRAEDALRDSESRLSAVFRASPVGISVNRIADDRILDINDTALRMYSYSRDQVIGRRGAELGLFTDPLQRREFMARLKGHGSVDRFEATLRRGNGEIARVEVSCRPISVRGEPCLVVISLDVTERRRQEAMNLQSQKLESLGTLAGGIAHDFNNILSAIRGNADLAVEDVGPDHPAAESLVEIRKSTVRASELVRRLLAYGSPQEIRREVVDVARVVDEVLSLLRATLPAGISIVSETVGDVPHVRADSGQVHEAIINLTINAADAIGSATGAVSYSLKAVRVGEEPGTRLPGLQPGLYVCLTISDSGPGMDEATQGRIFDAFYTTKAPGEGTGLGLSMVQGTMRSHGGLVTVDSAPGRGSSFALYFPAAEERAEEEVESAVAEDPPGAGRRVLYVDDETSLVFLAERVLSRLGHKVSGFDDPVAALAVFRAHPGDFDVVVTDLSMPHLSGFDLARQILALRPEIPVLMTTGYVRVEDELEARQIGIREIIFKPGTFSELGDALDRLFREIEST